MRVVGVRGAITCDADTKEEIEAKTQRLVKELLARNEIEPRRHREHHLHGD